MPQVIDNGNGTYTATYTVPAKGNYFLHIDVNYLPIAGSPFPVFFSNPIDPAEAAAAEAAAAQAAASGGGGGGGGGAGGAASYPVFPQDPAVAAMAAAAKQAVLGATAHSDLAQRTVYVSNLSPAISHEHYRQLFSIAGRIRDVKQAGEGAGAMLVFEYLSAPDADEAVKMAGMTVGERAVVVQNGISYEASASAMVAISSVPSINVGAAAPGSAEAAADAFPGGLPQLPTIVDPVLLQMQQMQQLQQMQQMQQMQVCLCR